MIKLRHFAWLAIGAILIACGEPAIQGVHYGENNTEHQLADITGSESEADTHDTENVEDTVVAVEPTALPSEAPTLAPTEAPTLVVTEGATEAVIEAVADTAVTGDPIRGQQLFTMNICSSCHMTDSQNTLVGPGLQGISQTATTRVAGLSAEEYIRQSILEPNTFVVPGFSMGIMPPTFGTTISEADIQNIIAYLMSL